MMKKKINHNLLIGGILTGIVVILIVAGFFYTPYDPDAMDAAAKFQGPGLKHILGCDNFGRDVFSRVLKGSGVTLFVAAMTVLCGSILGVILGAFTGYFGGILDEALMRINDAVFAFPSILLALVFVSLAGSGTRNVIVALGIAFVPSFARIVRGEFLHQRNLDYVQSARLMGASHMRIMFVHILPNVFPVLASSIMIGFNNAVIAEAGLSYLGIGVQPPDASLGRMLSESQAYLFSAPLNALVPGIAMIIMILGFTLLADGLKKNA